MTTERNDLTTGRARSLGNLRPWQPGQSGNPLGKAGVFAKRVRRATHQGSDLLNFLLGVVRDEKAPLRHRLQAAGMLLERGFGRVPAGDDLPGLNVRNLTVNQLNLQALTTEELEQLHRLVLRASAAAD